MVDSNSSSSFCEATVMHKPARITSRMVSGDLHIEPQYIQYLQLTKKQKFKAIPLLCDLWLCWGGRLNPCGHPVSSSQGNRIDSKSVIQGAHVSRRLGKWQFIVLPIYTLNVWRRW
uniref:Uncharacterized protein n=1 Tax=Oreochromis niloticus TaxID=8128 RepID=A0A669CZJ8_ORENI